jgi:hypothetical protein
LAICRWQSRFAAARAAVAIFARVPKAGNSKRRRTNSSITALMMSATSSRIRAASAAAACATVRAKRPKAATPT